VTRCARRGLIRSRERHCRLRWFRCRLTRAGATPEFLDTLTGCLSGALDQFLAPGEDVLRADSDFSSYSLCLLLQRLAPLSQLLAYLVTRARSQEKGTRGSDQRTSDEPREKALYLPPHSYTPFLHLPASAIDTVARRPEERVMFLYTTV